MGKPRTGVLATTTKASFHFYTPNSEQNRLLLCRASDSIQLGLQNLITEFFSPVLQLDRISLSAQIRFRTTEINKVCRAANFLFLPLPLHAHMLRRLLGSMSGSVS